MVETVTVMYIFVELDMRHKVKASFPLEGTASEDERNPPKEISLQQSRRKETHSNKTSITKPFLTEYESRRSRTIDRGTSNFPTLSVRGRHRLVPSGMIRCAGEEEW